MRSANVQKLTDETAARVLTEAQNTAPVDTEDYKKGLHLEHREAKYRRVTRVVGDDAKTLLIESKTGNLARALKAAKK
nr:HK97 gp10 family phage protein [Lysinibacter cavernae]